MPGTHQLRAKQKHIDLVTAKLPRDEAIRLVELEMVDPDNADHRLHLEFLKGLFLSAARRTREAAEFMDRCATHDDNIDSVQHQAGLYLLEAGEFARAIPRLSRCLEIATSSGDLWYESSARLMRAYCATKIGDFDLARRDLAGVDDDQVMGWIIADPAVAKWSVTQMMKETL